MCILDVTNAIVLKACFQLHCFLSYKFSGSDALKVLGKYCLRKCSKGVLPLSNSFCLMNDVSPEHISDAILCHNLQRI